VTVRLLTLGGLRAIAGDTELDWLAGQRLRLALLVYLAVERQSSREALCALFWPESDDENAHHSLRTTLYNLRLSLGREWMARGSLDVRATAGLSCDAHDFESALERKDFDTAAGLYAGSFLNAIHVINKKGWEEWVDKRRAHFARAFRKGCREWVNALSEAGDLEGAVAAARRWVAPDPFDDEAQHRLIEALGAAGDRTEALRQFDAYVKVLDAEGLKPLDKTKVLIESLRASTISASLVVPAKTQTPRSEPDPSEEPAVEIVSDDPVAPISREVSGGQTKPTDSEAVRRRPMARRRRRIVTAAALVGAGLLLVGTRVAMRWRTDPVEAVDPIGPTTQLETSFVEPTTYVVFPFERDSVATPGASETQRFLDAIQWWEGIELVDQFRVRAALTNRASSALTPADAAEIARSLEASRYILGEVSVLTDSVRVSATAYATRRSTPLATNTIRVRSDHVGAGPSFDKLVESLLFPDGITRMASEVPAGTSSVPAREAFVRGQQGVVGWDLARADSEFSAAVRADPRHAQSFLWLALVRAWSAPEVPARWIGDATRASAQRERLSLTDRRRTDALAAQGRGEFEQACRLWGELAMADRADFVGWYGYGLCLRADSAVMLDPGSPTGWRFRSSYHEAVRALRHAFDLRPAMHARLSPDGYDALRALLYTTRARLRYGRALAPDTGTFLAYALWQGDTLAFHAFREKDVMRAGTWFRAGLIDRAIEEQRRIFNEIATGWAVALPRSASALEAVAVSRELLGDPTALDTLRKARTMAAHRTERLRLAVSEVWMRVKFSAPEDTAGLRAARVLTDSLLINYAETPDEARLLASVAALTGRAHMAASLNKLAAAAYRIPAPLTQSAPALAAFAGLGGPADSLRALERRVETAIGNLMRGPSAQESRSRWLLRPVSVAFPDHRTPALVMSGASENNLLGAEAAFLRRDMNAVRRELEVLTESRRLHGPLVVTIDVLYPEAWLLSAIGDAPAALARIEPTLDALPGTAPYLFVDVLRAGALVRAMALRAELAEQTGDHAGAVPWARAVAILWSDADIFLESVLRRTSTIAGR
jgi:DNA-binding SARP family transcriptional activator